MVFVLLFYWISYTHTYAHIYIYIYIIYTNHTVRYNTHRLHLGNYVEEMRPECDGQSSPSYVPRLALQVARTTRWRQDNTPMTLNRREYARLRSDSSSRPTIHRTSRVASRGMTRGRRQDIKAALKAFATVPLRTLAIFWPPRFK